jgi:hypothetical protein
VAGMERGTRVRGICGWEPRFRNSATCARRCANSSMNTGTRSRVEGRGSRVLEFGRGVGLSAGITIVNVVECLELRAVLQAENQLSQPLVT